MLRIDLTYPINNRWIMLFDMRRGLLDCFGWDLFSHLRCYWRGAAQAGGQVDSGTGRQLRENAGAGAAGEQSIQKIGALTRRRVSEELADHLSKRRRPIGAKHGSQAIGNGGWRGGLGDLTEMVGN